MRKGLYLFAVLLASVACGGCENGGPLFTAIENFVNKEGVVAEDFAVETDRYREMEKERPILLKAQLASYTEKEKREIQDLQSTFQRYRTQEDALRPNLKRIAEEAEHNPGNRYFPTGEEY